VHGVVEGRQPLQDIALSDLTTGYLTVIAGTEGLDLDEVGEFMQLAARLILLKSEQLLPGEDTCEPDETLDDHARPILIDRSGISAGTAYLLERFGHETFAPLPHAYTVERPIEPRPASLLSRTWDQMHKRSGEVVRRVAAPGFVHLEVAVSTLIRHLRSGRTIRLGRLLRDANREDAVMHFLAVLELVRRRQATAEQPGLFEDIVIKRAGETGENLESRAG
jgi:segregation and condensation protein A